jgi:putative PIN family toxin of toxin-antitoxin system
MIVVLDTNVLVSGILKPHSKAAVVVRLAAEGVIQLAYDVRLISEYQEVLRRPKFGFPVDAVDSLLAEMEEEGLFVTAVPLKFRLPDAYDEPFLEVALAAKAEVLVTGNKRHFPKKASGGVRILSPAESLELLEN